MRPLQTLNTQRIPRCMLVTLIAAAGTLYALLGVMSWKFSMVGDEWPFFEYARMIAARNMLVNPFGLNGIYGIHRVLESCSQAIFLWLLGSSFFVWKLASIVMLFPSVIVFYLFVKELYGERIAFLCVPLLAFSKYLCNFFKIGYAHSFCFFLFMLCLYSAARLLNRPDKPHAVALGIGLGLAFFAYIGPVFVFLLLPFFVKLLWQKRAQAIPLLLIVALVMGAIISLGFITTPRTEWLPGFSRTSAPGEFDSNVQILINIARNFPSRQFDSNGQILINIARNFLLFWKNFDYFYNHFVEGPYLDVITRWTAALGIGVALFSFRTSWIILGGWGMLCLVLGLINPYWYTPTTRGIFFVPYGVLFAALGLEFLRTTLQKYRASLGLMMIIILISGINIYEAHITVFQRTGYSRTALIFRELEQTAPHNSRLLLVSSPGEHFTPGNLKELMNARHIQKVRFTHTEDIAQVCSSTYDRLLLLKPDVPTLFPIIQATCGSTAPPALDAVTIIDGYHP